MISQASTVFIAHPHMVDLGISTPNRLTHLFEFRDKIG
jgi:hypothetical protein